MCVNLANYTRVSNFLVVAYMSYASSVKMAESWSGIENFFLLN